MTSYLRRADCVPVQSAYVRPFVPSRKPIPFSGHIGKKYPSKNNAPKTSTTSLFPIRLSNVHPTNKLINTNFVATMPTSPHQLTGNPDAISAFIDRFDVSLPLHNIFTSILSTSPPLFSSHFHSLFSSPPFPARALEKKPKVKDCLDLEVILFFFS